jgi:hypothetical protein
MEHKKIEAGTCDASPNQNCEPNSAAYSKNRPETQGQTIPPMPSPESGVTIKDWRELLIAAGLFKAVEVVDGELGPIAILGSPRVCVGFRNDCTLVWICPSRMPSGWSDPFRIFLHRPGKVSGEAIRYGVSLAKMVRAAAEKAQERRDRQKAAVLREKFGRGAQ